MPPSQPGATGAAAPDSPRLADKTTTDATDALSPLGQARLAEMQRLETVGKLTGGVAHDFNNILAVVIGNAELLLESLPPHDPSRRLAEVTLTAARAGADLVRMLLAYSRNQPLQPVEFDANALIEEMLDLLKRSLGARVDMETALDPLLWGVRADRAQLGSAILNLAVNARDAMPEGGVLRIATGNVTLDAPAAATLDLVPGDYVGITVADSGAGIAPETIGRVFEPFFTTKQPGRGSGLGLSMVQAMVRQSGGQVDLSSTPGEGTVVRLHLPRAPGQPDLPPVAGDEAIPSARPGETILLVEDDEPVRRTVAERLRRLGYAVIAASDAQTALEALRKPTRIDLLFSDIDMPGLTGVSLADHARRARPALCILFTSAGGDTSGDDVVAPDQRFHHGYRLLLKPYRKQELARILRTALDELL